MATILGGPAVRKVQVDEINIWLVTDENASVEASLTLAPAGAPIGKSTLESQRPVRLGQRLFFYLLKIVPQEGQSFPKERLLYYDIHVNGQGLVDLGLTTGVKSITYQNEILPSLLIPEKHRHILQGSCRKPHAARKSKVAQSDQLTEADRILGQHRNDTEKRPTMLVLTGDQIYADDVATPLLKALNRKGAELAGLDEELPPRQGKNKPENPEAIPLHGRDRVLDKKEGFTSSHGKNHLMTFGEYVAMHLAVWGGIEVTLPAWKDVKDEIQQKRVTKSVGKGVKTKKVDDISKWDYEGEKTRTEQFLANTWKTRRLMANVPTYMMFDDHEVTDDWNLKESIKDALAKEGSLGRRVVTNALGAYWACQGWGNDPESFGKTFKDILSRHFSNMAAGKAAATEATLLKRNWSYCVPGYPVLVAIDTRTDRTYAKKGNQPKLLSEQGFKWLKKTLTELGQAYPDQREEQTLLLLSPDPVFGFKPLELKQEKVVKFLKSASTVVDAEYWSANKETYEEFLHALDDHAFTRDVIFLSGDVHYSYNVLESKIGAEAGGADRYFQLTSSALCNHPTEFGAGVMNLIERKAGRTPEFSYLKANGQNSVVNSDNSVGSVWFSNGLPFKAVCHFFDPKKESSYVWTYDLVNPKLREK